MLTGQKILAYFCSAAGRLCFDVSANSDTYGSEGLRSLPSYCRPRLIYSSLEQAKLTCCYLVFVTHCQCWQTTFRNLFLRLMRLYFLCEARWRTSIGRRVDRVGKNDTPLIRAMSCARWGRGGGRLAESRGKPILHCQRRPCDDLFWATIYGKDQNIRGLAEEARGHRRREAIGTWRGERL